MNGEPKSPESEYLLEMLDHARDVREGTSIHLKQDIGHYRAEAAHFGRSYDADLRIATIHV